AAGQGTRMKSSTVKVLHPLAGRPMLHYPVAVARKIGSHKIVIVVGHQQEEVKRAFPDSDLDFAFQSRQLGTGHAVMSARETLSGFKGDILVLCGDIPLIRETTMEGLTEVHRQGKNCATVLTVRKNDPTGYGRIVRGRDGIIQGIVEEKDASPQEREISDVNSGVYCFEAGFLFNALDSLSNRNAQNEYYLTDIIAIAREQGRKVADFLISDEVEVMGINTRVDLAKAQEELRKAILENLMLEGVTCISPKDTYVDYDVRVGKDTVIYPNSFLEGDTEIGESCLIEAGCLIRDSKIGSYVIIRSMSVITASTIEDQAVIGPFAYIKSGCHIDKNGNVGSFREVQSE
ncbi:MAG: bifunctional UDP-N-acetylglucosamine diphosphorylase/glucosamine-1-phosphate N-acetyltransferase GlmU, partial [Deltaproteobacteria bacterium]|nr:bifunctional UDP-N-acetylglucosamine diphosphorylase/glucosamine-1-phosphate N-acetyltransferase GlmU [Deltaproteobacteria bacterium]